MAIQVGMDNNRHSAYYTASTTPAASIKKVHELLPGEIGMFDEQLNYIDPASATLTDPKYDIINIGYNGRVIGAINRRTVTEYAVERYLAPTQQVSYLGYHPAIGDGDLYTSECSCCSLLIRETPMIDEHSAPLYGAPYCPCDKDEAKVSKITKMVSQITSYNSLDPNYLTDIAVVAKIAAVTALPTTVTVSKNSDTVELGAPLTAPVGEYLVLNTNEVYKIVEGNVAGSQFLKLALVYAGPDLVAASADTALETDISNIGLKFTVRPSYVGGNPLTPFCNNRSIKVDFNCSCGCDIKKPEWRHESLATNGKLTCCTVPVEDFYQLGMLSTTALATLHPYNKKSTGDLDGVVGACANGCTGFDLLKFRYSTKENDYIHNPRWMQQLNLYGLLTNGTPLTKNPAFVTLVTAIDTWLTNYHSPVASKLTP